jgi:hypothetical protein
VLGVNSCALFLGARTSDFSPTKAVESLVQTQEPSKESLAKGLFAWLTTIEEVITTIKKDLTGILV